MRCNNTEFASLVFHLYESLLFGIAYWQFRRHAKTTWNRYRVRSQSNVQR